MSGHTPGPVEILCREIGFAWDRRLEREDVFVAFVAELVAEVSERVRLAERIAPHFGKRPSESAVRAVNLAKTMVSFAPGLSTKARLSLAESMSIYALARETNPDDGPCDHDVAMLASCASAIRFGLESPCHSRHAAEAASHVWKHVYGVSRFDSSTPEWSRSWAREKLTSALIRLLPAKATGEQP